jgi:hypothetical protein
MAAVRIAHAEPRPGNLGDARAVVYGFQVVLADDAGHRALPLGCTASPESTRSRICSIARPATPQRPGHPRTSSPACWAPPAPR